jgi:hypothetical protein
MENSCRSDPSELCAEKGGILAVGLSSGKRFVGTPGAEFDEKRLAHDLGPLDSCTS